MNETQNTPELRFEGFTEPWEQRKVSDIATLRRGLTYSPSDVVSPGQGVRVLRSSNVDEDRFVLRNDDVFVKEEAVNIPFSRDGEVLITAANGSTRLVGKRAKISGLMGKTVHGGFMLIAATEQPDFLCALMGTEWYRNFLRIGVAGGNGAIGNLDSHALECEKIRIPSSDEQHLVGGFFRDLDSLIDLQQRKYERLQHLKQALLRKMFPKPGEQVPELRFNGFTEPWEERKLGELMDITSVRRVHQKDWCNSGVRFLRARDVVAYSKGEEVDDPLYISTAMYAEYSAQCGKVQKNDLLVTGVGTIGIPWLVPNDNPVYFKDGNIIWLKNRNALDGRFLYYDFMGAQIQTFIHETTGIGTVATFTIDTACKTPIIYPSQSEQHLIGSFFRDLDNLIALYRHKYERLKRLKQALLRKMFV